MNQTKPLAPITSWRTGEARSWDHEQTCLLRCQGCWCYEANCSKWQGWRHINYKFLLSLSAMGSMMDFSDFTTMWTGIQTSMKWVGYVLQIQLNAINAILYVIHCHTISQWRMSRRIRVMCSVQRVPVVSCTAACTTTHKHRSSSPHGCW